ncbi:hypothetical protein KK116_04200 [Enterobacter dykesii]|uniref:hypothetical protein n=1 Tax=Enterobacter dykesii TaxID=2797506 RepID=UPI001BE11D4E|nr:hypothetical protein [Enterobacter dykesii]MBT1713466.1 hypothetical protein [Enterobacter dykesii]
MATKTAKQYLKRDVQPAFPSGMRVSKAESILIVDFLTSQESSNYDRSFSSIIINKDIAFDLMKNLIGYIQDNDYSFEDMGIEILNSVEEVNDD